MEYSIEAVGISNKDSLMEIRKYLLPCFIRPLTAIVCVTFMCQSVYEILHASPFISFFFLLLALSAYIIYLYSLISIVNRYIQMMKGYLHTENIIYQLSFREDDLCITIAAMNISVHVPYSDFIKIVETKNFYFIATKAGTPVIITKESLINITKEDWLKFLKKKCISAKKIKFEK